MAWLREHLAALVRATGSSSGLIGRHNYRRGVSKLIASFGIPAEHAFLRSDGFDVPWLRDRRYFQAAGLVWRGFDIIANNEIRKSAFYWHVMEPLHGGSTLHASMSVHGSEVDHVLLVRPRGGADYSDDEVEVCRRYVAGAEAVEAGLLTVFEDRGLGVAIVDPAANILAANRTFGEFVDRLREAPTPRRTSDRERAIVLPAPIVERLAQGDYPSVHVVQAKAGETRFSCEFRPVASKRDAKGARWPLIAIVMSDLDATPYLEETVLQSAFGLSPAEARVSALVGRGDRLEDAAGVLGISPNTARTHLKRIFEKTETHRQAELVKVLLSVARRRP